MKGRIITKIGITGAAGHIGTTLAEGLPNRYQLTLFYHHREVKPGISSKFKTVRMDFSKAREVNGAFQELDAVIHLAADPLTEATWESVLTNNIIGTYNVFEEARRAGVSKIIFASSNHTQHDYVGKTPLTLDRFYVKTTGLSGSMTLRHLIHSTVFPSFSEKTWAGTTHENSGFSLSPCASGRRFLKIIRQSGKEPTVKTTPVLCF